MNDFLTRVVRRHRGEVATVRPRPAPLYAPDVDPASDELSEDVTWSQPASTTSSESTATAPPPHPATPTPQTAPRGDPPRRPVVDRLVEVPSAAGPDRESTSQAPTGQMPAPEPRPVPDEPRPGPDRTVPAPSPTQPDMASRAIASVAPTIVTERVTHTERVEVVPRLVRQDPSPPRAIDAPPSLVAAPVSRGRSDGADGDTAEPPVHVSIGRIEVTAVAAAPAPKRKTAPRQPSMSLHDYLARRRGKGGSS